ncbi:hypothetical protein [Ralstonia solanacearum]|uniref:hypothetical protein n=1 Tax=Ralstonia solanacearum TaxID=305 RepID=UPI000A5CE021|nr:hypothetical protein [Ralstonia solanacearum]
MSSSTSKMAAQRQDWDTAESRCAQRRELAGEATTAAVADEEGVTVRFRPIGRADVDAADRWTFEGYAPGWLWSREVARARRRPRRVEAAVYAELPDQSQVLCGLILGRISNRRVVASIHLLSRAPVPNPLEGRFAKIAVRYLEFCAAAFDCATASLQRPIPELVDFYKSMGYTRVVVKKGKIERLERDLGAVLSALRKGDQP